MGLLKQDPVVRLDPILTYFSNMAPTLTGNYSINILGDD